MESSPDAAIIATDHSSGIVWASPAFEQLVGMEVNPATCPGPPLPWWPPESIGLFSRLLELIAGGRLGPFIGLSLPTTILNSSGTSIQVLIEIIDELDGLFVYRFTEAETKNSNLLAHVSEVVDEILERFENPKKDTGEFPELASLSRREREVLLHLLHGERTADIAKQLFISPHTVRNHVRALFRKLGVHSHPELISKYGNLPRR